MAPNSLTSLLLLSTLAIATAESAAAQRRPSEDFPHRRPSMRAEPLSQTPTIDGKVVDDPAWAGILAVSSFWQTRPFAGEPASEQTLVRVAYSQDTLYVGVVCYDREPDKIIVSDSRRDASLDDTDSFRFIIDAFRDTQNGFVFGTNPAGIEYDGQVANEGGGSSRGAGRSRSGAGGGFNLNWDGSWEVAAAVGEQGWSAEFAIPFATLRYPNTPEQTWSINFQRNIRRRNETSYWASLEQQFDLYRLSEAGTVTGIETPRVRNLKIVPYVKLTVERAPVGDDSYDDDLDAGVDLKYGLTPSLTLDATYNTDFAQVEVDEQQINLDRFNLFFPEKRPFFLENAGLFTVGAPGEVELFFSRRIGISEDGDVIPIDGGGRVSGKAGQTNLGLMAMRTESKMGLDQSFAADLFGVVRASRELPNRSSIGVLFVHREETGSLAAPNGQNQTYAVDGKLGIGEYHTVRGWASITDTPGIETDDHAYQATWEVDTEEWNSSAGYLEVGEGFDPQVGFLARDDFRRYSGRVLRRFRPADLWGLHELRPHVSYTGYWDLDGFKETELTHIDNHWEWRNGAFLSAGINLTFEGVKEEFEISDGIFVQPGEYGNDEVFVFFNTNRGAAVSWSTANTIGGFFGGNRTSLSNTLNLRRSESLGTELTWSYNNINLPEGDFDTNLGRLRLTYAPTPRLLLQLLAQYNDTTDQISTNLRFTWLRQANTGLFIVYNEIDEFGSTPTFERSDRSLIIKYSHMIDVFQK